MFNIIIKIKILHGNLIKLFPQVKTKKWLVCQKSYPTEFTSEVSRNFGKLRNICSIVFTAKAKYFYQNYCLEKIIPARDPLNQKKF